MIRLTLPPEMIQTVLNALGEMPLKNVAACYSEVMRQVQAQQAAEAEGVAKRVGNGADEQHGVIQ